MNKYLMTGIALLAVSGAARSQTVLTESFATAEDFARWTVIDVNADNATWRFDETVTPSHVFYNYHGTNAGDDWLISPAISIPSEGTYLLTFDTRGSSYGESLEVWTGNAPTVAGMTQKMLDLPDLGYVEQSKSVLLQCTAGESLRIGFHAVTPADRFRLNVGNIVVRKVENPLDLAVTRLVSPVSAMNLSNAETVTVNVSNTGLNAVGSFVLNCTVKLGDETVKDITETVTPSTPLAVGSSMQYTFTEKVDMTVPRGNYKFTVSVVDENDIDPSNNSVTAEIHNLTAATVPYRMGFESDEDTTCLSFLNLNNDDGDWSVTANGFFSQFSRTGSYCVGYNYSANQADDWFFLDPMQLNAGYYVLKFWYSAMEDHPEKMRVCWGTSPTAEAMTNVLAEFNPMTNINYEESINIFQVPADGQYYIGFYAFSDADENWIVVDDISLDAVDPNAGDLEMLAFTEPFDYWRAPDHSCATVNVRNIGIVDAQADVVLTVDGVETMRRTETFVAQQQRNISLDNAVNSLPAGTHTLKVTIDYPTDSNLENNSMEKEVTVLPAQAVALWDFEDGVLPQDLTYRSEDSNTISPDAGDEFVPEGNGWGIFNLENYIFGTRALAGCSWFTSAGYADRWVVLPQVTVNGENAWFALDAASFNPQRLEDYRVKVSEGRDYWADYDTELSVDGESVYVKTRGINLGKYNGKTVYIAVNLKTYDGEALVIDNLGVYGDCSLASSVGVSDIYGGASALRLAGDELRGEGIASIAVYDMNGRQVAFGEGESLNVSGLVRGLYIARGESADGVFVLKFTR